MGNYGADFYRGEVVEESATEPGLVSVDLSEVKAREIEWLWPNRIPLGKLSIIAGDAGLGKSFVTLDMATRVSLAGTWPDRQEEQSEPGNVLLLSCEDGLDDTVVPRLQRAGADLKRIRAIEGVRQREAREEVDPFSLARDRHWLDKELTKRPASLVIIDPLTAYLGQNVDSHKDADVRAVLAPLATLAEEHRVAVVAVMHLNKASTFKAIHRPIGSVAFGAAARVVWLVSADKTDRSRRLFLPLKCNIAPNGGGLAFRIVAPGELQWEAGPVDVTADEALSPTKPGRPPSTRDDAAVWLRARLSNGPVPAAIMLQEGAKSFAERTLKRAKKQLGVLSRQLPADGEREKRQHWLLPDEECQPPSNNIYDTVGTVGTEGSAERQECHNAAGGHVGTVDSAGRSDAVKGVAR